VNTTESVISHNLRFSLCYWWR